jgi:hypothetical protein
MFLYTINHHLGVVLMEMNNKTKIHGQGFMVQILAMLLNNMSVTRLYRMFNAHPTGEIHNAKRLEIIMGDSGLANCGNSQNCVQSCPKGIPLTTSIAALNRDTTIQSFRNLFGSDK